MRLHRSERADALVDALGDVLSVGLPDPMEAELISVPTRGVERWLTQRLSGRLGTSAGRADGVCANVEFPFPGRLVEGAVAAASGVERDADPWLAERAVWPLLDVLEDCLEEPWLAAVAGHLRTVGQTGEDFRRSRRFSTARHITDLFDRYAMHRPAMLRAWASGYDLDDAGVLLADDDPDSDESDAGDDPAGRSGGEVWAEPGPDRCRRGPQTRAGLPGGWCDVP